jgi:hypothetical protein
MALFAGPHAVDTWSMAPMRTEGDLQASDELEFFGVKLMVKNPRLAALLNSSVGEDVQVIGQRAREAFAGADDAAAEHGVERRVLDADDSVRIRPDEVEDV